MLETGDVRMKIKESLKGKFNKFLEDVAKENKKQFGGKADCCSLNNQTVKKPNT